MPGAVWTFDGSAFPLGDTSRERDGIRYQLKDGDKVQIIGATGAIYEVQPRKWPHGITTRIWMSQVHGPPEPVAPAVEAEEAT